MIVKPDFCTDEMLSFLDGVTSMGGHAVLLTREFPELALHQAQQILAYWMEFI
jgi:hypothetical protein